MSAAAYRILIVDDSAEDRAIYRRRIAQDRPNEYTFFEVSLGEEGLDLCRSERPDCVLLDYNLPDLNGLEFLERLRLHDGDTQTPVVMLTGDGNESIAAAAIKNGAQDYLVKKVTGNDVRHVIHAAIDRVALEVELEEGRRQIQHLAEERTQLIEQLQQQATALLETDRRKDRFIAVLAHELRNPLGPIRNAAKILSLVPSTDAAHARGLEIIERQAAHMSRLVDDLLDVSRITFGKVLLRRERLDLTDLARTGAEDQRASIHAAGLTLQLDIDPLPVWIHGDATRLAQIIGNLLDNSRKFTDHGGSITLSVRGGEQMATVVVTDTGIGMDEQMLVQIFEPFNQIGESLTRARGGLGLGLALTRELIELHGGHVDATSDGIGQGCRISFTIPLDHTAASATPTTEPRAAATLWRVLIIEDNVDAADSLGVLLEMYGHTTLIAHSGPQGLRGLPDFKPQIVLCDIGLPGGMDGYAVAKAIRSENASNGLYLVAMTGYGQEDDRERARAAGFDLHLTKPVDPDHLEKLLQTLSLKPTLHTAAAV